MTKTDRKYSPSRLAKLEFCSHFTDKEREEDSEAALMGTLFHRAVEESRPEILPDAELQQLAMKCIRLREQLVSENPGCTVLAEQYSVGTYNSGTPDLVILNFEKRRAIIVDWKSGVAEVTAPSRNIQLWSYALQVFEQYAEIQEIDLIIMQPKLSELPFIATRKREDNWEIINRINRIIAAAEDESSPYTPDPENCEFCGNKTTCPAIIKYANDALIRGTGIPIPENYTLGVEVSAQELVRRQIMLLILADYCDQAKKVHTQFIIDNPDIASNLPGFKLIDRQGNLKVSDQQALINALLDHGVSYDQILEMSKISATKAVSFLAERDNVDAADLEKLLPGVERGNRIQYLMKTYRKETDAERLLQEFR